MIPILFFPSGISSLRPIIGDLHGGLHLDLAGTYMMKRITIILNLGTDKHGVFVF